MLQRPKTDIYIKKGNSLHCGPSQFKSVLFLTWKRSPVRVRSVYFYIDSQLLVTAGYKVFRKDLMEFQIKQECDLNKISILLLPLLVFFTAKPLNVLSHLQLAAYAVTSNE